MYYVLEPEVAGGWGDATVADRSVHPPVVSKLEYWLEGWPEDDILTTFPCYIVTEQLAVALEASGMTGFGFDDVIVTYSEQSEEFEEIQRRLRAGHSLPEFRWLKVSGQAGKDDFGVENTLRPREYRNPRLKRKGTTAPSLVGHYRLVVSERALELLRQFNLKYCEISEFRG